MYMLDVPDIKSEIKKTTYIVNAKRKHLFTSSPFLTALVPIAATSDPAPGSDTQYA